MLNVMRMENRWVGLMGGLAIVSGAVSACFYGPTWPESVSRGDTPSPGGSAGKGEGGTGFDAGDTGGGGDSGFTSFACTPVGGSCVFYENVPANLAPGLQGNCGTLLSGCSNSRIAGCCTQSIGGIYNAETCQYNPITPPTAQASCVASGGTFTTSFP